MFGFKGIQLFLEKIPNGVQSALTYGRSSPTCDHNASYIHTYDRRFVAGLALTPSYPVAYIPRVISSSNTNPLFSYIDWLCLMGSPCLDPFYPFYSHFGIWKGGSLWFPFWFGQLSLHMYMNMLHVPYIKYYYFLL